MLKVQNLLFRYPGGGFQLAVPELAVPAGESAALAGPSGMGKTTLLHLIAGILQPQGGTIQVEGRRVETLSEKDRRAFRLSRVGFVFQEFALLPHLSVRENILLPARLGLGKPLDQTLRRRSEELAEKTGMTPFLNRKPQRLSQGERQRTAVCRALLVSPRLILADEATGNLDPENRDRIWDILDDYRRGAQASVLAVTHDREILPRFDQALDIRNLSAGGGKE